MLLGAGIGAFIYEFIPQDLLGQFAVPIAALVGIPMYIRTETMIPIASILIDKGVGSGTMIAFLACILFVAVTTGYLFNIIM